MSKGKSNGSGDAAMVVVLQVAMHCNDCAEKVVKSLKGFKGVAAVKADVESGRVTVAVAGEEVDPWKLRDRVAAETDRKVELLSPAKTKPGPDKKKTNEVKVTTVVLKVELHCHCEGCIDKIRHTRRAIKGVKKMEVDAERNLVTVQGTMDGKALPAVFKEKLNLEAKVMEPKKKKEDADREKAGVEKKNMVVVPPPPPPPPPEVGTMSYYQDQYSYRGGAQQQDYALIIFIVTIIIIMIASHM